MKKQLLKFRALFLVLFMTLFTANAWGDEEPTDYVEVTYNGVTTYWAKMNLGATSIAEDAATAYGDYYAWGELEPYATVTWSDYKTGTITWKNNATQTHITGAKTGYDWQNYCGSESAPSTEPWGTAPYGDDKLLKSANDVVAQKIGNGWTMPVVDDYYNLYKACGATNKGEIKSSSSSISAKGIYKINVGDGPVTIGTTTYKVSGYLFVLNSNNLDNVVFLPCAGLMNGTSNGSPGNDCQYWTSTYYNTTQAFQIDVWNYMSWPNPKDRFRGASIRPVKRVAASWVRGGYFRFLSFEDAVSSTSYNSSNYIGDYVGSDISPTQDLDITSTLVNSGFTVTLDLNGHILKGNGTSGIIISNGKLTIKDSNPTAEHTGEFASIKGGIITGGSAAQGGGVNNNGGGLTLEGGTITGNKSDKGGGIYSNKVVVLNGKVVISGNTKADGETKSNTYFTIDGKYNIQSDFSTESSIGVTKVNTSGVEQSDIGFTYNGTTAEKAACFFADKEGFFIKCPSSGYLSVALLAYKIGDKNYASIEDAMADITESGATITMANDVDITSHDISIENSKNFTLDLNGHILRQKATGNYYRVITNAGTLTIADSNPTATHTLEGYTDIQGGIITGGYVTDGAEGGGILNYGTLTINGGTITKNSANAGGGIYNKGTFTLNSGTITGNTASYSVGGGICNSGTLTLNGGTITNNIASSYGGGIYTFENITMKGKVIIDNNTIKSGNKHNLYLCQNEGGTLPTITFSDVLTEGAKIGILTTKVSAPYILSDAFQFTTNGTAADATHFFADDANFRIKYITTDGGGYIKTAYRLCLNTTKNVGYDAVQDAIDAVASGNTLKLYDDANLTASLYTYDGTDGTHTATPAFTLDLNGHVLNGANIPTPTAEKPDGCVIKNVTTLTILDTNPSAEHTQTGLTDITGGVITGGKGFYDNGKTYGGGIYNMNTLDIQGGNITGNKADNGGGVYTANSNVSFTRKRTDCKIYIYGNSNNQGGNSNLCINSTGETVNTVTSSNDLPGSTIGLTTMKNGVEGAYKFTTSTSSYLVSVWKADNPDYVARLYGDNTISGNHYYEIAKATCNIIKADESEVKYGDLYTAFQNVATGETVKMISDENITDYYSVKVPYNKDCTLDLNGHVLKQTLAGSSYNVINLWSNLTITDSQPNVVHYFTVDSNDRWIINENQTTPDSYTAFEDLTARPASGTVIAVKGGCITGPKITLDSHGDYGYGINIVYNTNGNLTLQGGNIIGNSCGIKVQNSRMLNMTGGTVCGNSSSQYAGGITNYGTATISGGMVAFNTSTGNGGGISSGTVTITGTTKVCYNKSARGGGIYADGSNDKLLGGEIYENIATAAHAGVCITIKTVEIGGNVKIYNNYVTTEAATIKSDVVLLNKQIKVSTTTPLEAGARIGVLVNTTFGDNTAYAQQFSSTDATTKSTDAQYFFSDNDTYKPFYNAGGYFELKAFKEVANETDLKNAISNVASGTVIQLTGDIDLTAAISNTRSNTLDLNGHVLKQTASAGVITNSSTLYIIDSDPTAAHTQTGLTEIQGGVITGGSATNGGGIYNSGTLYLSAGTITGNKSDNGGGLYTNNNYVTVGGSVVIKDNTKSDGSTASNLYLIEKTVKLGTLCTGAQIGVTVAQSLTENEYRFTSNGSATDIQYFTIDNGTSEYMIGYNPTGKYLADVKPSCQIDDTTYPYIQNAIDVVEDGKAIKVIRDVTLTNALSILDTRPAFTLDLNTKTLTGASSGSVINNAGTVTVKNGTITGGHGTYSSSKYYGGGIYNTGTLTLEAMTITGNQASYGGGVYTNNSNVTLTGKVVINTNTVTSSTTTASNLYLDGTVSGETTTPSTITLSSLAAESNIGVTTAISKTAGAYQFTSNGAEGDKSYFFADNTTSSVEFVTDHFELNNKITVPTSIDHGTLTVSPTQGTTGTEVTITSNPEEGYLLDLFTVKDASNNDVTVTDSKFTIPASNVTVTATYGLPVCKIGDTQYASLRGAIAAVAADEEIEVTADVDLPATITVASSTPAFTLDLSGHTLNGSSITPAGSPVVENNGKLTITDNSTNGGGTITGAKSDKGGVYTSTNDLTLSGKVIISGNTKADGTTPRNLYLNDVTAKVDGLVEDANIGVTTAKSGTEGAYQFTSNGDESATLYFVADNTAYGTHFNAVEGGTSYLSLEAWKLGDTDVDEDVTVNDYNMVKNYIVDENAPTVKATADFKRADANEDKAIDATDLTKIVDLIYTDATNKAKALAATAAATSVNGLSVAVKANIITISADNASEFLAAQMDITLPEGVSVAKAESNGHTVTFGTLESGAVRLLIAGLENNKFSGNEVATVILNASTSSAQAINVDNAIFANIAFQSVKATVSETTGISNVDANVDVNRDGKFLENGKVVILKSGKKYNTNGQQLK